MIKKILILFIALFINLSEVNAQARGSSKSDGLYSKILSEQRDLLIQLPNSYYKNDKLNYPVLYLTDGLRNFNHASGTLDLLTQSFKAQEMIIVAIKNTHRTRDFTPTYDDSYNRWGISGGADKFLDFVEQELIPHINKNYRTTHFKILSGHSLGGLLSVYALQSRPHLFQAHFAFSPSLWWHEGMIFNTAKEFYNSTEKLTNYLYLNMANETGGMLSSFEKYLDILGSRVPEGFSFDSDLITHENHSTSALVGQNVAYHKLFKKLQCPEDVINQGLVAILAFYQQLSKDYGVEIKPDYQVYRQAGYTAFENKEYDRAIDIFKTSIKEFPHVADAYYASAYVLEGAGEDKRALDMVNKALEMSYTENVENNSFKTFKAHLLNKLNGEAGQ